VLCQFTDTGNRQTLSDFVDVPGVYPAGRLDFDSEGLVLLTDNGSLQARVSDPRYKWSKTYWAQVEGDPSPLSLQKLAGGIELDGRSTRRAQVRRIDEPGDLWPRKPPIRYRKSVADSWLEIVIREGRNRQVRRMTAAIGHPTLRLIRCSIGTWSLGGLRPGEWMEVAHPESSGG
jgi:23S rRNA pseudouridine2457 synthase